MSGPAERGHRVEHPGVFDELLFVRGGNRMDEAVNVDGPPGFLRFRETQEKQGATLSFT